MKELIFETEVFKLAVVKFKLVIEVFTLALVEFKLNIETSTEADLVFKLVISIIRDISTKTTDECLINFEYFVVFAFVISFLRL